jgi:hypothetical protein
LGVLYGLSTEGRWSSALVDPSSAEEESGDLEPEEEEKAKRAKGELVATLVRVVVAARRRAKEHSSSSAVPPAGYREKRQLSGEIEDVEMEPVEEAEAGEGEDEPNKEQQQVWDVLSISLGVLANVFDSADEQGGVKDLVREIRTFAFLPLLIPALLTIDLE